MVAQRKNTEDRIRFSHGTEQASNEPISQSLNPEVQLTGAIYRATAPTYSDGDNAILHTDVNGNLKTTATISGDVNVDSTSVDTSGYVGKASGTNADFTTAYASATTITLSSLPSDISSISADDIVTIVQVATGGSVTNTYSRDDVTIAASGTDPTTLTVTGASFVTTDTFIVYTNIAKPTSATTQYTAETTVPTAGSDGDTIDAWADEYGRPIDKSTNLSLGATDVNDVSPALLLTQEGTLLSAVTATGASTDINVLNYNKITFHIISSSVVTGGTMKIQSSIDGTNYADINTTTVSASGTTEVAISDRKYKYLRANLTALTDGTYTVMYVAGN